MNACSAACGWCGACTTADEPRDDSPCWYCGAPAGEPHDADCEIDQARRDETPTLLIDESELPF